MKKVFILLTTLVLSLFFVSSVQASVLENESADLYAKITNKILNENALVIEPNAGCNDEINGSGKGGPIILNGSLNLAGTDGYIVRVYNPSKTEYKARWYVNAEDENGKKEGFAAPSNASKYTLINSDGGVEYNASGRNYIIPAGFDGFLAVEWSELSRFQYQAGSSWTAPINAAEAYKLEKNGEDEKAYPLGNMLSIGMYIERGAGHIAFNPFILGEIMTFTRTNDLDKFTVSNSVSFKNTISSNSDLYFRLLAYNPNASFTLLYDENSFTSNKETYVSGDIIELTPKKEFTNVTLDGDSFYFDGSKYYLPVIKDYTDLSINTQEKTTELGSSGLGLESIHMVPTSDLTKETSYADYYGALYAANQIPLTSTDGLAVRIKNTLNESFYIARVFIRTTSKHEYMFASANQAFETVGVDGTVSSITVNGRGITIPANFDGWLKLDWLKLTKLYNGGTSATWNNTLNTRAPLENLESIRFTFNKQNANGREDIIIGDIATYSGANVINYGKILDANSNTLGIKSNIPASNTGYVNVYRQSFESLEITYDSTKVSLNKTTVNFLDKLIVSPVGDYSITSAKLGSDELTPVGDGTYSIIVTSPKQNALDATVVDSSVTYGDQTTIIEIEGKKGIIFDVNNTTLKDITYHLVLKDINGNTYKAYRACGVFIDASGICHQGNVFTIEAGYSGKVFIPFNELRGSTYGAVQNLPFDVVPETNLIDFFKLMYVKQDGLTNEIVEDVFANFALTDTYYENSDPTAIKLDSTVENGVLMEMPKYNNFGAAPSVRFYLANPVSFNKLGYGFYVENRTDEKMLIRVYFEGSDNLVYVSRNNYDYYLVDSNGTASKVSVTGRTINVPAGFKGTLVLSIKGYATDNIANASVESNILRDKLNVKCFRFYLGAQNGSSNLFVSPDIQVYNLDGTVSVIDDALSLENTTVNIGNSTVSPTISEITYSIPTVNVVVDGESSTLTPYELDKASYTIYETIGLNVTGEYVVLSVKYNDKAFSLNEDTYEYKLTGYISESDSITINLSTDLSINKSMLSIDSGDFEAYINSTLYTDSIQIDKNTDYNLTIEASEGYQVASVKVNDNEITAVSGIYTINIDEDSVVTVSLNAISYDITYHLDGGATTDQLTYTILDEVVFTKPSRTNYRFIGYFLEDTFDTAITKIEKGTTGDFDVYAKWEEVTYLNSLPITELDKDTVIINPLASLEAESSYSGTAGYIYSTNNFSLEGTDGIAFRITNFSNSNHYIARLMIHASDNYEYMLANSTPTTFSLIDSNGEKVVTNNKYRGFSVPANFDGWFVIEWSQLTALRKGGSDIWNGPLLTLENYPTTDFEALRFTLDKRNDNQDCVIAISDIATFVGAGDNKQYINYGKCFTSEGNTLATKDIEVSMMPIFTTIINHESGNYSVNKATVKFGDTLVVTPYNNYLISSATLDGVNLTKNSNETYSIRIFAEPTGNLVVTTVVAENYQVFGDSTSILNINNMTGIIFDINNNTSKDLVYTITLRDTNDSLIYVTKGSGLFIPQEGLSYYGNPFEIPNGFVGKAFIPFNTYRGTVYGEYQNVGFSKDLDCNLFDYFKVTYDVTSGITKDDLSSFSNFKVSNHSLKEDDIKPSYIASTVDNGITIAMPKDYEAWGAAPRVSMTNSLEISFNQKAIVYYIENNSDQAMKLRIYYALNNGMVYVPTTRQVSYLVLEDGTVTSIGVSRTLTIPAGFKGTFVNTLSEYATDSISEANGTNVSNMLRTSTIKEIRFYVGGKEGASLSIGKDIYAVDNSGNSTKYENAIIFDNSKAYEAGATLPIIVENAPVLPNVSLYLDDVNVTDSLYQFDKAGYMPYEMVNVNIDNTKSVLSFKVNDTEITKVSFNKYQFSLLDYQNANVEIRLSSTLKFEVSSSFNNEITSVKVNNNSYTDKLIFDDHSTITLEASFILGYELDNIKINGVNLEAVNGTYSFVLEGDTVVEVNHKATVYTITYHLDGGRNSSLNPETYTILNAFGLSNATKNGFKFVGWYTDSDLTNSYLRITKGTTGNLELYAKWEEVEHIDEDIDQPSKSGCGSIVSLSMISFVSLISLGVMFAKRKRMD